MKGKALRILDLSVYVELLASQSSALPHLRGNSQPSVPIEHRILWVPEPVRAQWCRRGKSLPLSVIRISHVTELRRYGVVCRGGALMLAVLARLTL
jgi:hypothetical protein